MPATTGQEVMARRTSQLQQHATIGGNVDNDAPCGGGKQPPSSPHKARPSLQHQHAALPSFLRPLKPPTAPSSHRQQQPLALALFPPHHGNLLFQYSATPPSSSNAAVLSLHQWHKMVDDNIKRLHSRTLSTEASFSTLQAITHSLRQPCHTRTAAACETLHNILLQLRCHRLEGVSTTVMTDLLRSIYSNYDHIVSLVPGQPLPTDVLVSLGKPFFCMIHQDQDRLLELREALERARAEARTNGASTRANCQTLLEIIINRSKSQYQRVVLRTWCLLAWLRGEYRRRSMRRARLRIWFHGLRWRLWGQKCRRVESGYERKVSRARVLLEEMVRGLSGRRKSMMLAAIEEAFSSSGGGNDEAEEEGPEAAISSSLPEWRARMRSLVQHVGLFDMMMPAHEPSPPSPSAAGGRWKKLVKMVGEASSADQRGSSSKLFGAFEGQHDASSSNPSGGAVSPTSSVPPGEGDGDSPPPPDPSSSTPSNGDKRKPPRNSMVSFADTAIDITTSGGSRWQASVQQQGATLTPLRDHGPDGGGKTAAGAGSRNGSTGHNDHGDGRGGPFELPASLAEFVRGLDEEERRALLHYLMETSSSAMRKSWGLEGGCDQEGEAASEEDDAARGEVMRGSRRSGRRRGHGTANEDDADDIDDEEAYDGEEEGEHGLRRKRSRRRGQLSSSASSSSSRSSGATSPPSLSRSNTSRNLAASGSPKSTRGSSATGAPRSMRSPTAGEGGDGAAEGPSTPSKNRRNNTLNAMDQSWRQSSKMQLDAASIEEDHAKIEDGNDGASETESVEDGSGVADEAGGLGLGAASVDVSRRTTLRLERFYDLFTKKADSSGDTARSLEDSQPIGGGMYMPGAWLAHIRKGGGLKLLGRRRSISRARVFPLSFMWNLVFTLYEEKAKVDAASLSGSSAIYQPAVSMAEFASAYFLTTYGDGAIVARRFTAVVTSLLHYIDTEDKWLRDFARLCGMLPPPIPTEGFKFLLNSLVALKAHQVRREQMPTVSLKSTNAASSGPAAVVMPIHYKKALYVLQSTCHAMDPEPSRTAQFLESHKISTKETGFAYIDLRIVATKMLELWEADIDRLIKGLIVVLNVPRALFPSYVDDLPGFLGVFQLAANASSPILGAPLPPLLEKDLTRLYADQRQHVFGPDRTMSYETLAYALQANHPIVRRAVQTGFKQLQKRSWAISGLKRFIQRWCKSARERKASRVIVRFFKHWWRRRRRSAADGAGRGLRPGRAGPSVSPLTALFRIVEE